MSVGWLTVGFVALVLAMVGAFTLVVFLAAAMLEFWERVRK